MGMGVDKLYKKLKKLNKKVTLKQVKNWLKNQATYQIHYSKHKKIKFLPIFSHKSGSYQMDLTEMPRIAGKNKGFRYILTAIQINTRKLYAYKSKSKSAASIKKLLNQFKRDVKTHNETFPLNNRPRKPYIHRVTTDAGGEFKSNKNWFRDNDIELIIVNPNNKKYTTGKIERVHRSLKDLFNRYFTAFDTVVWYNMLDKFVKNYNTRVHRVIKMMQNDVGYKEEKVIIYKDFLRYLRKRQQLKFLKGDLVRIRNVKRVFEKGEILYSSKVYKIRYINPSGTIKLKDSKNKILNRNFKDYELQFVGTSLEQIKNPKERKAVERAEERALARNRFARTGLDTNNIIRSSQLREGR